MQSFEMGVEFMNSTQHCTPQTIVSILEMSIFDVDTKHAIFHVSIHLDNLETLLPCSYPLQLYLCKLVQTMNTRPNT